MDYLDAYHKSSLFQLIQNDISNNMVKHAYLLCGYDEMLLKYYSQCVAMHLLCEGNDKPCHMCRMCQKIKNGNHLDVYTYPLNNAKNIATDEVNSIVEETINAPIEGNKKVFILNKFEDSNHIAQNKLLKTLEEPTQNCYFIINCTNKNNVLNTIKSRCYQVNILPLGNDMLKNLISENARVNKENLDVYVSSSNGNITKAMMLVEDKDFLNIKQLVFNLFYSMKSSGEVLDYSAKILTYRNRTKQILEEMVLFVRDLSVAKTNKNLVMNVNKLNDIVVLANFYTEKALVLILEKIELANSQLEANCSATAVVDSLLMNILEVKFKCQK